MGSLTSPSVPLAEGVVVQVPVEFRVIERVTPFLASRDVRVKGGVHVVLYAGAESLRHAVGGPTGRLVAPPLVEGR